MKVLIVDDDTDLLEILVEVLSLEGHQVRRATSGNDGKGLLMAEPDIDLVISDYMMPNGNGKELLDFVRQMSPMRPGFFMMTGHANMSAEEMLRDGAQACIYKPFDIDRFISAVNGFRKDQVSR